VEHGGEPQHLLAVQQLAISQGVLQHSDGSLDHALVSHDRAAEVVAVPATGLVLAQVRPSLLYALLPRRRCGRR